MQPSNESDGQMLRPRELRLPQTPLAHPTSPLEGLMRNRLLLRAMRAPLGNSSLPTLPMQGSRRVLAQVPVSPFLMLVPDASALRFGQQTNPLP